MITLSESALTTPQWDALQTLVSGADFDITLYAWNPVFDTAVAGSVSRNDFDSAVYSGILVQYSGLGVNGISGYSDPAGVSFTTPPSLITDTNLYAAAVTSSGISQTMYNGSWSGWSEIVTDSTVAFMAQTSATTIHYVTFDGTNYQFHVSESGVVTDSDIYWGFPMTSFSARRINGKDVLAFTANTPGTPSAKTENLQVVKYILPTGIVGVITYQYGTWSDHIEVDRVDQWSAFRYRINVKLSVIDSTLWMTAYSSEGTAKQPVVGTRIYTSKDGTHWSRGELTSLARSGQWGVSLQRLGSKVYALGRLGGSSADATLMFGSPASSTFLSLSRFVHQLTINRRDMQQLTMVVDNHQGQFDSAIVSQSRTLALLLRTGFWTASGSVMQQQGIFEVDSIEPLVDQPDQMVQISARDHMAWMTTKTQSEQFVNWLPQGLGLDAYIDTTGTGYGGMTHSAPADGTWKAHDNNLYLTTSNQSGLVYSTYLFDTWNGSVQSNFALAQASNHEYAGLIFRSQDKDNGYAYYYDQTSDKLRLERWSGGIHTLVWQSSAKSWGSTPARYLRADFRYSQIRLFSSTVTGAINANISWTLENTVVVSGFTDSAVSDSGYVGMLAKGFSDIDSWNGAPDPIGPGVIPPWYDPFVLPTVGPFPVPDGTTPTEALTFSASEAKATWWTDLDTTPVPHALNTGLSGVPQTYYSDPSNYGAGFCFNSGGVDYASNLGAGFSTWVNRRTLTQLYGVGATQTLWAKGSHLVGGWGMAQGDNGYYAVTTDNWVTCTAYAGTYYSVQLAPHNSNVLVGVYVVGQVNGVHWAYVQYDYSLDGGVSWAALATNDPDPVNNANNTSWLDIEIPYLRTTGANNLYDSGLIIREVGSWRNGGTHTGHYQESSNKGVSFAYAIDTTAGDSSAYLYGNTPYHGAVSTHTWDAKVSIWSHFNPGSPFNIHAVISLDHGVTIYSNTALFSAAADDYPVLRHNGWPSVATTNPLLGYWISSCYFAVSPTDGGVMMTGDNGGTWTALNDPGWTHPGSVYAEYRLATVQ